MEFQKSEPGGDQSALTPAPRYIAYRVSASASQAQVPHSNYAPRAIVLSCLHSPSDCDKLPPESGITLVLLLVGLLEQ